MQIQPAVTTVLSVDFLAWREDGTLELSPKFQRREVWNRPTRAHLIDTMLRGYPIPPIHIRVQATGLGRARREVIDGQQRLNALLGYIRNEFRLANASDSTWSRKTFDELDPEDRQRLLEYRFTVFQYDSISDQQVLEIFARMNSYSVPLNAQELRGGKYFGKFRATMESIAYDHLEFWRRHRIFTEISLARMQEVQLVSELAVMLLDGLQDKKTRLDEFYANLDDSWGDESITWRRKGVSDVAGPDVPQRYLGPIRVERMVGVTLSEIAENLGPVLAESAFRRPPLFYSVFGVVAHLLYGIPGIAPTPASSAGPTSSQWASLRDGLGQLSELLDMQDSERDLSSSEREFVVACSRQTDNIGPRRVRFDRLLAAAQSG